MVTCKKYLPVNNAKFAGGHLMQQKGLLWSK